MSKIRFLLFLIVLVVLGCSNNPNEIYILEPAAVAPEEAPSVFKIAINGVNGSGVSQVYRYEDTFTIQFGGQPGLCFDKDGRFGYFKLPGGTSFYPKYYSFRDFSSHYFDFLLLSVDEVHKRIKGSFSGYVYAYPNNRNSDSKFVTGTFDLVYEDMAPSVSNVGNDTKINGEAWAATNSYSTRTAATPGYNIIRSDVSNGAYKIMVHYRNDTAVGTYNFTNANVSNKVQLAKYDPATDTYTNYISTGTMTVTKHEGPIYAGNYTFTAVNPNNPADIVQVTNGKFKFVYMESDFN